MTPDPMAPPDEVLCDALATVHDSLAGDDPHNLPSPAELPADVRERFSKAVPTLRLLRRKFGPARRPAQPEPTEPPAPPSSARYALRQLHAMGGVGEVWLATDTFLGREVALKELRPERSGLGGLHERLLQEARVTSRLQHPGVVPVYELVEDPAAGDPFFTMRFVRGRTLGDAARTLHTRPPGDRRVELLGLLNAFVSVCNTVAYAHAKGVVHRDLKPENVLLGDFGEVIVIDWGFAKVRGEADGPLSDAFPIDARPGQTVAGAAVGTPAYMAPEQAAGDGTPVDERADIYGLGAILYEILTGRPPYVGGTAMEILRQVREGPPPRPESVSTAVPPGLAAVCRTAMARDPGGRYASADALARDVQRWLADLPPTVYREPPLARLGRFARHHRTAVAAAVTLLLAAAGGMAAVAAAQTRAALAMAAADARSREEITREQEETHKAKERAEQEADRAEQERHRVETERTRAEEQRVRAEQAREHAAREQAQAEWHRYLHLIARAEQDLQATNLARCAALLDECPPAYRGWEWDCLQRLRRSEPILLKGHTNGIRTLAFRPGRHHLATAGYESVVRVWDVPTGAERFALKGFKDVIGGIAYSEDGTRLAAGGWEGKIIVWDAEIGTVVFTAAHPGKIERVRFSPDGRRLMSVGNTHVRVWDAADGTPVPATRPDGAAKTVRMAFYTPDSRLLLAADTKTGVGLFDHKSGRLLGPLGGTRAFFRGEAVSPDGKWIAASTAETSYGGSSEILLSDAATGKTVRKLVGHRDPPFGLAFTPDGKRLASAGYDQAVRVWDPETGEETLTLWGHADSVRAVGFSSDGRYLASGGDDTVVRVWDTVPPPVAAPRYETFTLRGHGQSVIGVVGLPNPAGPAFASVGEDDSVRFWDADTGTEARKIPLPFSWATCIAVAHDGACLAVPSTNVVNLFDVKSGKRTGALHGHGFGQVMAVAFGPDGKRAVTGGWDRTGRLWSTKPPNQTAVLGGHTQRVAGVAFDPARDRVATAGGDGVVKIWDAKTGKELATLPGPGGACRAVAFSPDGRWLAGAGGDGSVALWDAASWDLRATLRGHAGAVDGLAFRPDSQVLATASSDWTAKLWWVGGTRPPHEVRALRGHNDRVNGVAFAADGRRLATASSDGTVKVWDVTGLGASRPSPP